MTDPINRMEIDVDATKEYAKQQRAIHEAARFVGIPDEAVARLLGTLKQCGYELTITPPEALSAKAVAWIATKENTVLHLAAADGWSVEAVQTVSPQVRREEP